MFYFNYPSSRACLRFGYDNVQTAIITTLSKPKMIKHDTTNYVVVLTLDYDFGDK